MERAHGCFHPRLINVSEELAHGLLGGWAGWVGGEGAAAAAAVGCGSGRWREGGRGGGECGERVRAVQQQKAHACARNERGDVGCLVAVDVFEVPARHALRHVSRSVSHSQTCRVAE